MEQPMERCVEGSWASSVLRDSNVCTVCHILEVTRMEYVEESLEGRVCNTEKGHEKNVSGTGAVGRKKMLHNISAYAMFVDRKLCPIAPYTRRIEGSHDDFN